MLVPLDDIRAIADWSDIILKVNFKKRNDQVQPDTRKPELFKMMIHALMLERRRIGRLGPFASSGAMSVDPPSAKRARSLGAMSVKFPAHSSKTFENRNEMGDSFIIALSDSTGMLNKFKVNYISPGG